LLLSVWLLMIVTDDQDAATRPASTAAFPGKYLAPGLKLQFTTMSVEKS
jgi:hypothetical protein